MRNKKPMRDNTKTTVQTVSFKNEILKKVKTEADKEQISFSAFIQRAVINYLASSSDNK